MSASQLRVIIVGGGPVGLIAAHILTKVGVDFVVLERGSSVYPDVGASLIIWPMTFRIFDQLDILDPVRAVMTQLERTHVTTVSGNEYQTSEFKGPSLYGYGNGAFHRADLLKVFYDTLPEEAKARILTGKKVVGLDMADDGVSVTCADGTTYHGSMVVAADGVNSKVRDLARALALESGSPEETVNEALPYPATYKVLFGNAPRMSSLAPGEVFESHGYSQSTQLFVGKERMWFFAYRKLPEPTRERVWYGQEEADQYAEEVGDVHIAKDITLREVYATKNGAGLTNVGEGVIRQWSWKRVVFVGDAAHKLAPNFGWGLNSGIQDLTVLSNQLCKLMHASAGEPVNLAGLEQAFHDYQAERSAQMASVSFVSARVIRSATWATPIIQLLDRWIMPTFGLNKSIGRNIISPMVTSTAVLDFLEEKEQATGSVPWLHIPAVASARQTVTA
ncbi:FAD/NAD(P)-binding domain-containing protein [Thozetella sp. PMI_491]|nr:FAD/NAD(P)-binding domain-containing protein [Thozetella sp. PMI_491]